MTQGDQSTESQKRNKKQTSLGRAVFYYWKVTKAHLGLFILSIVTTISHYFLLTYANPYVMSLMVDKISDGTVAGDEVFNVFAPYIIALIAVNLIGQAASKLEDFSIWQLQIKVSYDLATMSFDALCHQSMSFHTEKFGGTLVSQTSKFIRAYSLIIDTINYPFLSLLVSIISVCTILAAKMPLFVFVLMILLLGYAVVSYRMFKSIVHLNEKAAFAQSNLSGELFDAASNILQVKTYGREDFELNAFKTVNKNVVRRDSKRMIASIIRGVITALIAVLIMSIVAVFVAGGHSWFGISPGNLVLMFTYTYSITNQFNHINSGLQRFNRAFGDARAMVGVLDETCRADKTTNDVPELQVTGGDINISNVSFNYHNDGVEKMMLNNLNLHIKPGQHVGLVGVSGSGKTTLVKLILRLFPVQSGSISIDGQDIAQVSQTSLRKNIAYVPQESLLFHRTIEENIGYGKHDATKEEIIQASKAAGAYDFIMHLPDGFKTIPGEHGFKLSEGQRQRIFLARAILSDRPIVILDDATSALDSESEAAVQKVIMKEGHTALVIAQRLSSVASLDRIVVLRNGKIIEDGTHDELVALDGAYARIWNRQVNEHSDNK